MAIKKSQSKAKSDGPKKYATSEECLNCGDKCVSGKKHMEKLNNKKQSNCPMCPKKV
jgi:hypothetical protein